MSESTDFGRDSYSQPKLVGILKGPTFLEHELLGQDGEVIPVIDDPSGNSFVVINDEHIPVVDAINSGVVKDVVDLHRKLSQEGYDLFAKRAEKRNKPVVIPVGVDTTSIQLDRSLKHHFLGSNIIGVVPKGSRIGDGSIIESDAVIENCVIGQDCTAGDNVTILNSKIGSSFEAGHEIQIDRCIVDSCMVCSSIYHLSKSTVNFGLMVEVIEHFDNDNIILPGYHVGQIDRMGTNNVIVGERRLPVPNEGGEGNLCVNASLGAIPINSTADDVYKIRERLKADKSVKQAWGKFSKAHELNDDPGMGIEPGL